MAMANSSSDHSARASRAVGLPGHANQVVVGEIAVGKFITMVYLVIDPRGMVDCASAGHPAPRLVLADGRVEPLECGGLALGIDAPQTYEPVRAELPSGAAVVLYTDGVIEARRGSDLFGSDRLDVLLAERAGEPAQAIADESSAPAAHTREATWATTVRSS